LICAVSYGAAPNSGSAGFPEQQIKRRFIRCHAPSVEGFEPETWRNKAVLKLN
jgi:hypothetical protein